MSESRILLLPVCLPIITGFLILCVPSFKSRGRLLGITAAGLAAAAAPAVLVLMGRAKSLTLFYLTKSLPIYFKIDAIGAVFAVVFSVVWVLSGFFAFEYMKQEKEEKRFFGFYLMAYGALTGLAFSGNLITFYLFYELVTLLSLPMVLHDRTHEAVMAGLKYLFYSMCGAYLALYGIFFFSRFSNTLTFTYGGTLNQDLISGREPFLLVTAFFMILGFGVKAGMFPMHGWLPTAHPQAPSPASAVLSGVIVKAGVLGVLRTVYYSFGPDFIKGTWVQNVWLCLSLFTVFMGSMLAYREKLLKKRLAYSTVSQVSYILFGLALLNPAAMTGALLHVIGHAFIKAALFLSAGAILYKTGKTNVDELTGIGKEMPALIWCYTAASLGLIGIPPTGGFISKWYLAIGALDAKMPVFSWLGPVTLLISALLTAGYLLPVSIKGFFPGDGYNYVSFEKKEPNKMMLIPIVILTALSVFMGMFPAALSGYLTNNIWVGRM